MNQFFSFNRFNLLVLKHWADNKKRYGLSILAFIGLLTAWFVFMVLTETRQPMQSETQEITFYLFLFVLGAFYSSQYFSDLSSGPKGSNFILVPASTFEKFLCSLLYSVILYVIVFATAYYLVDVTMVAIAKNSSRVAASISKPQVVNVFKVATTGLSPQVYIFLLFFSVQSAFLFGSVFFRKYNFIKTVIAGFVICFSIFCLLFFSYKQPDPLRPESDDLVELPVWVAQLLTTLVMYVIAPVLWTLTYFQLKQKQV